MKRKQGKNIQVLLLTIAFLSPLTTQLPRKIKIITVTRIPKNQPGFELLNTSRPIRDQLSENRLNFIQNMSKGTLLIDWKEDFTMAFSIYLRSPEARSIKDTHILAVEFPFRLNQSNISLSYTLTAESEALRLNPSSIEDYSIEQELYLFKGKKVNSDVKPVSVRTKIIAVEFELTQDETTASKEIKYFEAVYESDDSLFTLEFDEEDIALRTPLDLYNILIPFWAYSLDFS